MRLFLYKHLMLFYAWKCNILLSRWGYCELYYKTYSKKSYYTSLYLQEYSKRWFR